MRDISAHLSRLRLRRRCWREPPAAGRATSSGGRSLAYLCCARSLAYLRSAGSGVGDLGGVGPRRLSSAASSLPPRKVSHRSH